MRDKEKGKKMDIKYRWNSRWTYKGDSLDFISAGPEAWGCCVAMFVLIGSLTLVGCGVTKGVKALTHKDNKPKTEQLANKSIKPQDVIAYNNVNTL